MKKIKELAGQLINRLVESSSGIVCSASMKQLISEIKTLITKPNTTKNKDRLKELIGELISQLPGDTSPTMNTTKSPFDNNGKKDAVAQRRASRRARWAERAAARTQNKNVSSNNGSDGKNNVNFGMLYLKLIPLCLLDLCLQESVESTFKNLSQLLSGLISSINLKSLFSALKL